MSSTSTNFVKQVIEASRKINATTFNITRCAILALTQFVKGGIQFRELQTLLNVSDGKLQSNLDVLKEMGYLEKNKVPYDNKDVTIFTITQMGQKELEIIVEWVDAIKKMRETSRYV